MKTIILVTGHIGVGKSSFAEKLMKKYPFNNFEYINTDLYYHMYFKNLKQPEVKAYAAAKEYCVYKLEKAISKDDSFLWETVAAKEEKHEFLKKCRSKGYNLITVFLDLKNIEELNRRIKKRYKEGCYSVPEWKIEDRYWKLKDQEPYLIQLSDVFMEVEANENYHLNYIVKSGCLYNAD